MKNDLINYRAAKDFNQRKTVSIPDKAYKDKSKKINSIFNSDMFNDVERLEMFLASMAPEPISVATL